MRILYFLGTCGWMYICRFFTCTWLLYMIKDIFYGKNMKWSWIITLLQNCVEYQLLKDTRLNSFFCFSVGGSEIFYTFLANFQKYYGSWFLSKILWIMISDFTIFFFLFYHSFDILRTLETNKPENIICQVFYYHLRNAKALFVFRYLLDLLCSLCINNSVRGKLSTGN